LQVLDFLVEGGEFFGFVAFEGFDGFKFGAQVF